MCLKVSTRAMATSTAFRERPSNAVERPLWSLGGGTVEIVHRLGSVAATAHQGAPRLGGGPEARRPQLPSIQVTFSCWECWDLQYPPGSLGVFQFPVASWVIFGQNWQMVLQPSAQDATCLYSVGLLLLYAGNRRRGWDLQRWDITIWLLRR